MWTNLEVNSLGELLSMSTAEEFYQQNVLVVTISLSNGSRIVQRQLQS